MVLTDVMVSKQDHFLCTNTTDTCVAVAKKQ